jgi:hypothetical protein
VVPVSDWARVAALDFSNLYVMDVGNSKICKIAIVTAVVCSLTGPQKLCRTVAHKNTN